MSARAAIKTGDLNRLLKAAKAHGFMVEFDGGKVRLLPTANETPLPSDQPDEEPAWERRLAAWRRSA